MAEVGARRFDAVSRPADSGRGFGGRGATLPRARRLSDGCIVDLLTQRTSGEERIQGNVQNSVFRHCV